MSSKHHHGVPPPLAAAEGGWTEYPSLFGLSDGRANKIAKIVMRKRPASTAQVMAARASVLHTSSDLASVHIPVSLIPECRVLVCR